VKADDSAWEATLRVAELLLTGAVVIGITVVSGGVVAAGQFRSLGLSGTETVAALPRTELLARGADQLLPYALIAGGAALFAYAVIGRDTSRQSARRRIGVLAAALLAGLFLALYWEAGWPAGARILPWCAALGVAGLGAIALGLIAMEIRPDRTPGGTEAAAPSPAEAPVDRKGAAPSEDTAPASEKPAAPRGDAAPSGATAAPSLDRSSRTRPVVAAAIAATVVVFGIVVGYPHAFETPHKARPAALELRSSHAIFVGVWGAATKDWVYIGQLPSWSDEGVIQGHMLTVPRDDVAAFSVGRRTRLSKACARLADMVSDVEAAAALPRQPSGDQHASRGSRLVRAPACMSAKR
jgi:hypothetical protein